MRFRWSELKEDVQAIKPLCEEMILQRGKLVASAVFTR